MFKSGVVSELRLLEIQAPATGLWSSRALIDSLHTAVDEQGIHMRLRLI